MEPLDVIGIAGPAGAGKDTTCQIVQVLAPEHSLANTSAIIAGFAGGLNKAAQQAMFTKMKEERGERWLHPHIREVWELSGKPVWILNSVRMPWDAELVEGFPRHAILYVDAPDKLRFERVKERARRGEKDAKADEKSMTFEEFLRTEQHETARAVAALKKRRGVVVVQNDKTPKELGTAIIVALLNKGVVGTPSEETRKNLDRLYIELASR